MYFLNERVISVAMTTSDKQASVMDDTWMLPDNDPWLTFQDAVKCLNDAVEQLEGNFDVTYDELTLKLTGVEKQELERTQQITNDFVKRWEAKCKEAENLRLSLKRALHESTRVNDEYHEMEESISKMRQQFGLAIDSSVTEIEELAICNNSLSERIEELELKAKRGDKVLKNNAKSNLEVLRKLIASSHDDNITVKSLVSKIEREASKLDRMILMDNFSSPDDLENSLNLTEKSKKMMESISQGLLETLKRELKECRNIIESQKQQIITMEKEKEEFIENQLIAVHNGDKEIKDLLDYLQKITNREKSDSPDDSTELSKFKRNFKLIKNIMNTINTAADKTYKQHSNVTGNISELKENIGDLNDKIKEYTIRIDDTMEERNMFKRKQEHSETQIDILNAEISSLQARVSTLDKERKLLVEENNELKTGTANMEDHFSVLNVENKELVEQIKTLQKERDTMYTIHEENVYKLNQICHEKNECEEKYENLESAIVKIRREYQDQNREVSMLSKENEDLKRTLQDEEEDKRKIRSNMKSLETLNRDLEDHNFELKSEVQKLESENKKLQQSCADHKNNSTDLDEKIQNLEKQKIDSILKFADEEKEKKKLQDKIKAMEKTNGKSQERVDKRTLLLGLYEKLVIKLLHHFKEIGLLIDFEVEAHSGSVLCSSMSLEYKEKNEIEASLNETSHFTDTLFQAISSFLMEKEKQKLTFHDLSKDIVTLLSENEDVDSCYGTENDDSEFVENVTKLIKFNQSKQLRSGQTNEEELQSICIENKDLLNDLKKMKQIQKKLKLSCKLYKREIKRLKIQPIKSTEKSRDQAAEVIENNPQTSYLSSQNKALVVSRLKLLSESLEKMSFNVMVVMENNVRERLKKDVENILRDAQDIIDMLSGVKQSKPSTERTTYSDGLDERLESIQQQRQYMLDHMSATNNRLEVLLNTLKGRQDKVEMENSKYASEQLADGKPLKNEPALNQVRPSSKKDEIVLERAENILELTKAISASDAKEIGTEKAANDNQKEVFGVVKILNENMDSVLREARSNISTNSAAAKLKSISENESQSSDMNPAIGDVIPKSEFLKVESELKDSLQKAQEKVELLSNFLAERESEIQERDRIIAQLNVEYEKLKKLTQHNKNDVNIATRDRMIKEYKAAKQRLEQENEFLQHVVKELRHELYILQQNFRKEEDKQKHLDEFIQELQVNKKALEMSLDKMALELSILQKDREQLINSFQSLSLKPLNQFVNPSINESQNQPVNRLSNRTGNRMPDYLSNQPTNQPGIHYHTNPNDLQYMTNLYKQHQQNNKFVNLNNFMTPERTQKVEKEKFAYLDMSANNRSLITTENVLQQQHLSHQQQQQHLNHHQQQHQQQQLHIQQQHQQQQLHMQQNHHTQQNHPHHTYHAYPDKAYLLHNDLSTSTAIPHSEDDLYLCTSCDECESLPSDNEEVMSSADSHTTSSSIKVARNISINEATDTIKSRNRPMKYVQKEIDSGLALISPRTQAKFRRRSLESIDSPGLHRASSSSSSNTTTAVNGEGRVMGRREQRYYSHDAQFDNGRFEAFTPDLNFRRFDPNRLSYDSRRKTLEQMERNYSEFGYYQDEVQQQRSKLRSNSTEYFKPGNKQFRGKERVYKNPVPDIDLAIERASLEVEKQYLKEQQKYIQSKQILDASFRNPNFEKKKKKKFLSFGKK